VGVKITPLEEDALNWQLGRLAAAGRPSTRSTLLYDMAQRGSLRALVSTFVAQKSLNNTISDVSTDG
jgi:hypothetical protein